MLTHLSVPQWVPTTMKHQALEERASERTGREKALETETIQGDGDVKRNFREVREDTVSMKQESLLRKNIREQERKLVN